MRPLPMQLILLLVLYVYLAAGALQAAPQTPATPTLEAKPPIGLIFRSYDGNPKSDKPEHFFFQIESASHRQPSEFLKLGDQIPHTHLKLFQFAPKTTWDPQLQQNVDASELIIVNVITGKTAVLTLGKVVDVSAIDAPTQQSK